MQRATLVLALSLLSCGGSDGDPEIDFSAPTPPAVCEAATEQRGEGTYYAADGSGNCSFDPSPGDLRVAAINTTDYAAAAMCGACITATGPKGSVTVRIVDRCPGCAPGDVDFSESAFVEIADMAAGRVPITWEVVSCGISGPLRYRFKEGSSEFWTAIQVRNHPLPIAKLEVQRGDGSYLDVPREPYNYFVASGLGAGPYHLRLTDSSGEIVEDDVELGDAVERTGAAQFAGCD